MDSDVAWTATATPAGALNRGGGAFFLNRKRRHPRQPEQPPHLKTDNRTEGHARVQIWAAGLSEPAAHLGETEGDESNERGADQVSEHAPDPRQAIDFGWETEDPGPDDAVDRQGH